MRIQDLCSAAPSSEGPPESPRPRAERNAPPEQPPHPPQARANSPPTRLPAISALLPKTQATAPPATSALTVTIRIPSKHRAKYSVESNGVLASVSSPPMTTLSSMPVMTPELREMSTPTRERPKRKRSEDARKRESAQLLDELHSLEATLTKLKRKNSKQDVVASREPHLERTKDDFRLYIASLGCMLMQRVPEQVSAPIHQYIHLGCTMEERRRTILSVKPEQLQLGRQLVEERSKFLDLTKPHSSNEWYTTVDGDVCGLHFFVEHVEGAHNVQRAYNASVSFVSSYDVTAKKTVSVVTYHDDEIVPTHQGSNIQLRVVLKTPDGPIVEANTVLFAKYDPDENTGIIVGNYVDKDDLRPYEPTKRVRQEVTAVCLLSPTPTGVTMRHWIYVRTRSAPHLVNDLDFGPFVRENQGHSGEELMLYMRNKLLAAA